MCCLVGACCSMGLCQPMQKALASLYFGTGDVNAML